MNQKTNKGYEKTQAEGYQSPDEQGRGSSLIFLSA